MSALLPVVELVASIDARSPQKFIGRVAWMLDKLVEAGEAGLRSIAPSGATAKSLHVYAAARWRLG